MINFPAIKRVPSSGLIMFEPPAGQLQSVVAYFERNDVKHNKYYTVKINTPRRPRSTGDKSQNHRINGFIQQIAMSTGQPFDDIKKRAKQLAVDMGYPMLTDESGLPIYDLWGNIQGISESDASVEDAILLSQAVEQIAAFVGVVLRCDDEQN